MRKTPGGFAAEFTPQEAAARFEELDFACGAEMLAYCEHEGIAISEAMCHRERCMLAADGVAVDNTRRYLERVLSVMRESATAPITSPGAFDGRPHWWRGSRAFEARGQNG